MDNTSGYAITPNNELVNVFAVLRGGGYHAIQHAITGRSFLHLNCYAGPLERIYAIHGFTEVRREPNWHPGKADVVYMEYGIKP